MDQSNSTNDNSSPTYVFTHVHDDTNDNNPSSIDLSTLTSELTLLNNTTNKVLSAIQCSVEYSSSASLVLAQLSLDQLEELSSGAENLHNQAAFIADLFFTLQMKMAQLCAVVALLPQYEKELDTIITQLPYLEKRVAKVVRRIKPKLDICGK